MRLDSITVAQVLGLARVDVRLSAVNVFAGDNAQGKSSLADAISMALCGNPSRVKLKKEYGQLLHDDAPKGRVTITYDDELSAEFRLPKGDHHADPVTNSDLLDYVLQPSLFSSLSPEDRKTFLFRLTGCKPSKKAVLAELEKIGVTGDLADEVTMWLKGGFPAACSAAETKAREQKGAWRQVTGENWGEKKSEGWKAEPPVGEVPTAVQVTQETKAVSELKEKLEAGIAHLAKLEGSASAYATHAARLEKAEELTRLLERREAKAKNTAKDLAEWEERLPSLTKALAELRAGVTPMGCPCCQAALRVVDGKLELFEGLRADTAKSQNAAVELQKAKEAVEMLRKTHANDLRDIAESQAAAESLDAIAAEQIVQASESDIERTKTAISQLREMIKKGGEWLSWAEQQRAAKLGVKQRTDQASVIHAEINQWLEIAKQFSPDGIPAQILADAMAPVNQSLSVLAGLSGWKAPEIDADMQVLYGGRLYGLCSASEKWRADALIAIAISQISGLRLVVLDGFDILHVRSRQELVKMLVKLDQLGAMDTSIIMGTMKELPKFPAPITAVWVQNGIAEQAQ